MVQMGFMEGSGQKKMNQCAEGVQFRIKDLDHIPQVMEKSTKSFKQERSNKIRSVPETIMLEHGVEKEGTGGQETG